MPGAPTPAACRSDVLPPKARCWVANNTPAPLLAPNGRPTAAPLGVLVDMFVTVETAVVLLADVPAVLGQGLRRRGRNGMNASSPAEIAATRRRSALARQALPVLAAIPSRCAT